MFHSGSPGILISNSTGSLQISRASECCGVKEGQRPNRKQCVVYGGPKLQIYPPSSALPLGLCVFLIAMYRGWLLRMSGCCRQKLSVAVGVLPSSPLAVSDPKSSDLKWGGHFTTN